MSHKACVIITTINAPTPAVLKYVADPDVDVIVVADRKTPEAAYRGLDCEFLSLARQKELAPAFDALLPFDHYARKNMGYLWAIRRGYDHVIETDDDNIPHDDWAAKSVSPERVPGASHFVVGGPKFVNVYRLFTDQHIWPRGLPLNRVLDQDSHRDVRPAAATGFFDDVSIIQGLADGDPDVDAVFRLTARESLAPVTFAKTGAYYKLGPAQHCPGNTQNTVWRRRADFPLLYVPSYVSFRFCDILKMYVAQAFVRRAGRSMVFQGATVFQDRNPHDYFKDYLQESEMYVHVDRLVALLDEGLAAGGFASGPDGLKAFYARLVDEGIVKDRRELPLLAAWLEAVA
jgi:hypothetical protein